jgi:hypothetical protein
MTGPLWLKRCMFCNRLRTGETWALGLDALLEEDRVGWLCHECEAQPGRAWEFIDVVRALYPAAVVVSCTAYPVRLVCSPLVLPAAELTEPPTPRRSGPTVPRRLLPGKPAD